jgi:type I restriction enzyme, S subunit
MTDWQTTPLGKLLSRSTEIAEIQPDESYKEITVKLWGKGVVLRGVVSGSGLNGARRFLARKGQLILSRIDARNGAIGLVPALLDGALVTNDFPLFTLDKSRVVPSYFNWLSKTASFVELCRRASEGTTNRVRLQEERFLDLEIQLPSLPEQRRIVERIDELAAQAHEARTLREQAKEEAEALVSRATSNLIDEVGWRISQLRDVLSEAPRNGLSPKPELENGGRPMLRINAVSSSPTRFVDLRAVKMVQVSDEEAKPFELRSDDVFIVRYNGDIDRVAKAGIYKGTESISTIYPDKLMRLRPDSSKILPDFLAFALASRGVRQQVEQLGKTTAGNIGISGANAKSFQVPVPPIWEQRHIVAELDALQGRVDALKKLQAETAAELDAMLPSILDKAFKGKL